MNSENICFLTFSGSFGVVFGNSSWFIPAGLKFLCFSGSFLFQGERRAFLYAGGVPTSPALHVQSEQGMGYHDKKGSL